MPGSTNQQALNFKIAGLYTHPDTLSEVPPGALATADNIVREREGIASTRRGQAQYGSSVTVNGSNQVGELFSYRNTLLWHFDGSILARDAEISGSWVTYSESVVPPEDAQIQSFRANGNFYFTTNEGVKKLDALDGDIVDAGGPRAISFTAAISGSIGFLDVSSIVAYRHVWGFRDANNNLVLGPVSNREVAATTASARDVELTIDLPNGVTTSHFVQIYRSAQFDSAATPDDELQLVLEKNPTASEITVGEMVILDDVIDALRGATIYTAQSQEGIAENNYAPPLAKDVALFKTHAFYANTSRHHRLSLQLLSVGGSGLVADDTIIVGGITYEASSVESAASNIFQVSTGGTPSENLEATAKSLVRVINQSPDNSSQYGFYVSGLEDIPGMFSIENRSLSGSAFIVISSRGTAFSPEISASVASTNEARANRVYISKPGEPEAVPLLSYQDVGSRNEPILRITALRELVLVWKTDGIFSIAGDNRSNFSFNSFDDSTKLLAPRTCRIFSNTVFAYTNQGVVKAGINGTEVVSRPIERTLLELQTFGNFADVAFAVPYESSRNYILWLPTNELEAFATQAFVYNEYTEAWTRWPLTRIAGLINPADDKLYTVNPNTDSVYKERKSFSLDDFADDEFPVTIADSSGLTVTLASTIPSEIAVGDTLIQGGRSAQIEELTSSIVLTVSREENWSNASATVYEPIVTNLRPVPIHAGNPGILKHFRAIDEVFDQARFEEISLYTSTNIDGLEVQTLLSPTSVEGEWGGFPWGGIPWGGGFGGGQQIIRTLIPRNHSRAHWLHKRLSSAQAKTDFAYMGFSLHLGGISEKHG